MATVHSDAAPSRLTLVQWLIAIVAAIGFAFDSYVLLMLPLIVRPALAALVNAAPGTPQYSYWVGLLFWIPAIAGDWWEACKRRFSFWRSNSLKARSTVRLSNSGSNGFAKKS